MKISIRNLWLLVCAFALLGAQLLPTYAWADAISSAGAPPALMQGVIGKVTYLLGQADITQADGSVLPLTVQMTIPEGSRIQVKERGLVRLLMIDGGIEKLGAGTVFTFDKYTYDPNDIQATEIRKTLLEGEVTSTTGQGGQGMKERYRLNSPLAAIGVLGTEYTVNVSKGETWVTVHSGEISIAKLGGSCQRFGLGACVGGERLSEGQRGLALVVRANEPKPILMPATAIPVTETKAETPPTPVKEAAKEKDVEKASTKESETAEKTATTEKPAEPETQKSPQAPTAATASTSQPDNTKQQDHTSSTAMPSAPALSASTATAPPALPVADTAPSLPEPKAVEKTSAPLASSPAPMTEKSAAMVVAKDERNPIDTIFTAPAVSTVESAAVSAAEYMQAPPSVTLEAATPSFVASKETVSSTPQQEIPVVSNSRAKQSLVQSSNSTTVSSVPDKVAVAPVVATPVVATTPAVETIPVKLPVVTTVAVTPSVVPLVTEKLTVETVPKKPKETTVTAVVAPVMPVVEPVPEKPKETTVTAVVAPVMPVVEPVPEKPSVKVVTPAPTVVSELPSPTVNWGKYDPAASVDGKTSFSDQVNSSYTQLLQPVSASTTPILQQNPSVSPPESDKRDVGVAAAVDSAVAPVSVATPVAATVSNADTGKMTPLPSSSSSSTTLLSNDSVVVTPQTPSVTAVASVSVVPVSVVPVSVATPVTVVPLPVVAPITAAPLTPLTLTPPLASP